jgi:hypothetical protein
VRFDLVPVGNRRYIVLTLEQRMSVVADLLQGDPEVLLEVYGVQQVPSVEAVHWCRVGGIGRVAGLVASGVERVAEERGAEGQDRRIGTEPVLERPGPADVVLGAGPTDRRPVPIAIDEELELSLAPPVALEGRDAQVGADVLAVAVDPVQDDEVASELGHGGATPLGVEVPKLLRKVVDEHVVDTWPPSMHGTGGEDYFSQAWVMQRNAYPMNGTIVHEGDVLGYQVSYRFHLTDPIRFEERIKVTMEHGHANHLADDWSSTAYWYQTLPSPRLDILPVQARLPRRPESPPRDGLAPIDHSDLDPQRAELVRRQQERMAEYEAKRAAWFTRRGEASRHAAVVNTEEARRIRQAYRNGRP